VQLGDYLTGVLFLLPTLGASFAAAVIVLRKRYGYLGGLPRALALSVLATSAVVFVHLLPLALGVLTRGTVVAAAAVALAGAWALPAGPQSLRRDQVQPAPAGSRVSIAIAAASLAAVAIYELARLRPLFTSLPSDIDLLAFHLPGVARWIQTGTAWQVDQFLPGFATAQYPNNGDILMLAAVLPWHDLAFARIPGLLLYALTGGGVYGLALELGATRAAAATFAAVVLAIPTIVQQGLYGSADELTLSMMAIGVMFLVRSARNQRRGELGLGGLALGLALGAKWFGLTAAAVVVVVWCAGHLLVPRLRARLMGDGAVLVGTMGLGGGFWLVRNLIESGNPLYPKAISVLGLKLFAGSHGDVLNRFGYSVSRYLLNSTVLRKYIYPAFKVEVGLAAVLMGIGVVFAVVWSVHNRGQKRGALLLAVALSVIGIFAAYVITPGSAYGPINEPVQTFVNIRWLMPAAVIAAPLCAALATAIGSWGLALEVLAAASVLHAITLGPSVPLARAAKIAIVLAIAAGVVAVAWRRFRARPRRIGLTPIAGFAAVVLVALVAGGRIAERRFDRQSYAPDDPVFAWIDNHAPSGQRIGLTGSTSSTSGPSAVLPIFGPRLGNDVTLVGDPVVHSLELPRTKNSFERELRAGRYNLLVIGLPYSGQTDSWARQLGFRQLARSYRIALYAIPPALYASR